jgi:RND family efflux transporter MFP subunit
MKTTEPGTMKIGNTTLHCHLLMLAWLSTGIGCNSSSNEYAPPPPPQVTVAQPVQQSITPFLEQNGVIEAVEEATVRARVRGFVQSIEFNPGQRVAAGDVLYKIESDQYLALVNSATADVAASEAAISVANAQVRTAAAELTRTEQNLGRMQRLLSQNAASQAELDAAVADRDAALAAMESSQANVQAAIAAKGMSQAKLAQAQLDLDYTIVKSPISGRISTTDVKVGNLVENGGDLATVVNRDQVYANFSVSDREMLRIMKARRAELQPGEQLAEFDWSTTRVYLKREIDEGFPFAGVLNYVEQAGIDAGTGTLALRAQFDNADDQLFPGLFVTVRLPKGTPIEALLIPEHAVQRDQRGAYALVVNDQRKVERMALSIAEIMSGWAVIEQGLTPASRVVIDGLQRAIPGLEVDPIPQQLTVDDRALLRGLTGSNPPAGDPADAGSTSSSEVE